MTTEQKYDGHNRMTETIFPYPHPQPHAENYFTETKYDLRTGKQSEVRDKRGFVTRYEYDDAGNTEKITYPDETAETFTYDGEGNRLNFTDRADRTRAYEYDKLNRPVRTVYPDSTYTLTAYDAAGRVAFTEDENRNRTAFTYDAAGRRTELKDALGNVTKFAYDAAGNQVGMTDAGGRTVTFEYDAVNRRVKTVYPDGSFTATEYSGCCGQKASETDQGGKVTKFRYDASGRLIGTAHVSEGAEIGASYSYDEAGNKRFQTDPNSNTTEWEYDNLGRVTAHTLPLGMSESFVYDPNGNVTEKTDFNADKILYAYDDNNRPVKKTYPDGSEVSFTYTPTGQRESVTDGRGTTTYVYDLRDRLKAVTDPDGTVISYTYDDAGNRTSVTVPSGTTAYTYDALNRLKTVTDPDGGMTAYTYDSVGNRKTVRYPNGTVASYMYDRLNRLIKLENRNISGDLISGYIYTLGPAGNRQQVEELHSGRVVNYTYDDLCRLTEEKITDPVHGNETVSYTYDSFGNRLSRSDSSGTVTYTYDDNDRLKEETKNGSVVAYTYDDNGNTLSRIAGTEIVTYGYDYENRLVSVQGPGGATEYAYDADGIRVRSVTDGVVTNYLADKNRDYAQVLEERDSSGNITVSYVYGDDLISQRRSGSVSYYHYDGLGSTRSLTDAAGNVTDTYTYEAFGDILHHTGSTENDYLFTGEQYDSNAGFYYLRARYYNPGNGRFVTTDPWQGSLSDPETLHRYVYGKNNPVIHIDPSGHFFTLGETGVANTLRNILSKLQIDTAMNLMDSHDRGKAGTGDEYIGDQAKIFLISATLNVAPSVLSRVGRGVIDKIAKIVCFIGGTPVHTAEGLRPIEEIRTGDFVLSYDEKMGEIARCKVFQVFTTPNRLIFELKLQNDNGDTETFGVTGEHPFRTKDRGWVGACDLLPGDEVFTSAGGWLRVSGGTWLSERQTVYNFEVDGFHSYFVGRIGALVHNGCSIKTRIHPGKQGKHILGHNDFIPGRSELTYPEPQRLLDIGVGKGHRIGQREHVDFGMEIGTYIDKAGNRFPTTRGTIHYGKEDKLAHIVPAPPVAPK